MSVPKRRALKQYLSDAVPWLHDVTVGPATVDAGACGNCGVLPGIIGVCGPVAFQTVCASCVTQSDLFCDGHADVARYAETFCSALPPNWAEIVVLWWVATGELKYDGPLDVDAIAADPAAQRVGVDELVGCNAELFGACDVFFPVVDE